MASLGAGVVTSDFRAKMPGDDSCGAVLANAGRNGDRSRAPRPLGASPCMGGMKDGVYLLLTHTLRGPRRRRWPLVDRLGTRASAPAVLPESLNETLRPSGGLAPRPRNPQHGDGADLRGGQPGEKLRKRIARRRLSPHATGPTVTFPILFLKSSREGRRAIRTIARTSGLRVRPIGDLRRP